jgi:hypothetical protein
MKKTEQNRVLAWRLKVLREASAAPRNVAQPCRHFGLSRKSKPECHLSHGTSHIVVFPLSSATVPGPSILEPLA